MKQLLYFEKKKTNSTIVTINAGIEPNIFEIPIPLLTTRRELLFF